MIGRSGIQLMQPRLLKHAGAALAVRQRNRGVALDGTLWVRSSGT